MVSQAKELAQRFMDEVLNRGNMDALSEALTEDHLDHTPMPGVPERGIEGVRRSLEMIRAAFPDLHQSIDEMVEEGDKLLILGTFTGTHQGDFMGIPATGKRVSVLGMDLVRIENGKFAEHWGLFDQASLMQQLGMLGQGAVEQPAGMGAPGAPEAGANP